MHRLIFLYGCDLVERDCLDEKRPEKAEHFVSLVRSVRLGPAPVNPIEL